MKDKLQQITDKVWLWPHHPKFDRVQASIGVLCGDDETLLVDAGNSPKLASQLQQELQRRDFPPVRTIIYTHYHWDHVYGASVFDAQIVAHSSCRNFLQEERRKPWSMDYLEQEISRNPKLSVSNNARMRVIMDWDAFEIMLPEIVFEKTKTLDMGGVKVELEHVGGRHSEDSIVVKVPSEGVMFLGDCYYPPPLHLRGTDISISVPMLESLVDDAFAIYLDGHSKPITITKMFRLLRR